MRDTRDRRSRGAYPDLHGCVISRSYGLQFAAEMYESNLHAWHVDRCKSKKFIYRIEFFAYPCLVHSRIFIVWVWICHIQFCPSYLNSLSLFHITWDRHLSYRAIVSSTFDNPILSTTFSSPTVSRVKILGDSASVHFYFVQVLWH